MKKLYKLEAITDVLASGLVVNFKVTKAERVGFNEMEGNIYHVNVKLETVEGYKNKLVTFEINDTYFDYFGDDDNNDPYLDYVSDDPDDDENETLEQHIESLLFSFYVLN